MYLMYLFFLFQRNASHSLTHLLTHLLSHSHLSKLCVDNFQVLCDQTAFVSACSVLLPFIIDVPHLDEFMRSVDVSGSTSGSTSASGIGSGGGLKMAVLSDCDRELRPALSCDSNPYVQYSHIPTISFRSEMNCFTFSNVLFCVCSYRPGGSDSFRPQWRRSSEQGTRIDENAQADALVQDEDVRSLPHASALFEDAVGATALYRFADQSSFDDGGLQTDENSELGVGASDTRRSWWEEMQDSSIDDISALSSSPTCSLSASSYANYKITERANRFPFSATGAPMFSEIMSRVRPFGACFVFAAVAINMLCSSHCL